MSTIAALPSLKASKPRSKTWQAPLRLSPSRDHIHEIVGREPTAGSGRGGPNIQGSRPADSTTARTHLVGCNVSHWTDGKVTEEWEYSDYLGLLMQLGVIPPLG
jgi:hypothetical protein